MEGVFGARGETHLIDQFGVEQFVEDRVDSQFGE